MEEYCYTAKSFIWNILLFIITLILLMTCNRSFADSGINPEIDVPGYNVGGEKIKISDFPVGLITDKKGTLSINDIADLDKPDKIISSRFIVTSDSDSYWFIFNLTNNSNGHVDRIVRFDEPYIDNSKQYNDLLGHQAGDDCIREVARILNNNGGRDTDTVAGYGGEEFSIILPNTKTKGALKIAETIKEALTQRALPHPKSEEPFVTISFGVGTLVPSRPVGSAELVAKADQALYQSKRDGRNRFTVAK